MAIETSQPAENITSSGESPLAGGGSPAAAPSSLMDTPVVQPLEVATLAAKGNINLTSEQLSERLTRARSTYLKELGVEYGIENEAQLHKALKTMQASEAAAESTRQAQMTKEQKLAEERDGYKDERDAALLRAQEAEFDRTVGMACATLGIKNVGYASHLVMEAGEAALAQGHEAFDETAYLTQMLENPSQQAALGMVAPPIQVQNPANTTTNVPDGFVIPAPVPDAGGLPRARVDANKMTREEFNIYKQSITT